MQRFPRFDSNPELSGRFVRLLLQRFTLLYRELLGCHDSAAVPSEILRFALSPPPTRRKRPPDMVDLSQVEPAGLQQFLQELRPWFESVSGDRFFSPQCLLQFGLHLASAARYGPAELQLEPRALDFTSAYLRFFLEDLMAEPAPLYGDRVAALVRGWSTTALQEAGIPQPLIDGLQLAAQAEELLQQSPSLDTWSSLVDSLPVFDGWGSQHMQRYLGQAIGLGERLCQLWHQAHASPVAPGPDLAEAALATLQGKLSPLRFQRFLELGAPRKRTQLGWEVLPPGFWRDPALASQLRASCRSESEWRLRTERLEFIDRLGPLAVYLGQLGEHRNYHVFEFPNYAVAECEEEGNALYIVDKRQADWQEVLALSKRQALQCGAQRIFHFEEGHWQRKLVDILQVPLPPLEPTPPRASRQKTSASGLRRRVTIARPEKVEAANRGKAVAKLMVRTVGFRQVDYKLAGLDDVLPWFSDLSECLAEGLEGLRESEEALRESGVFSYFFG